MKSLSCILASAAVGALLATAPAFAQSTQPADRSGQPSQLVPEADTGRAESDASSVRTPSTNPPNMRASNLIGATVYNAQNEAIGDINDLLLASNGSIDQVVVGVGGFLGMGERNVALKFSELDIRRDDDAYRIGVPMTKAQLQALPQWQEADK